MTRRLPLVAVLVSLVASGVDARQATQPQLTKPQRETLRTIVAAVDAAVGRTESDPASWRVHVLRASDGSHYVAFSVASTPEALLQPGPLVVYVRLATASLPSGTPVVERSVIGEWLAGARTDPRLLVPKRGFAVGEMPLMGAGALLGVGATDLQLMDLERERSRQKKEAAERQRRADLEGTGTLARALLPFEDFDVAAAIDRDDPVPHLDRAITAGPGDYELYVAWSAGDAKQPPEVHIVKHPLRLPPASPTTLGISSVILADRVGIRAVPYAPAQQTSHPYSIGLTEIVPARDNVFTRDERLAVAFQVINALASETGKPKIAVTFRITRLAGDREVPVASLTPQRYDGTTLPADFDLRVGHPLFAAVAAPLATIPSGTYRLRIGVSDLLSGSAVTGESDFVVVGTAASLLADAPPLGQPFRRDMVLGPVLMDAVVAALLPPRASAALAAALEAARGRRFIDLVRDDAVEPGEQGVRAALTGLALYALGDTSSVVQFQGALRQNAPAAPVQLFIGAAMAVDGRDADAITAWRAALDGGLPASAMVPLLVNAHLRRADGAAAAALLDSTLPGQEGGDGWWRAQAAAAIAAGREREAIAGLQSRLEVNPGDIDAHWLLLHALFAGIVRDQAAGVAADRIGRFTRSAQTYVDSAGLHAALAQEWIRALTGTPPKS